MNGKHPRLEPRLSKKQFAALMQRMEKRETAEPMMNEETFNNMAGMAGGTQGMNQMTASPMSNMEADMAPTATGETTPPITGEQMLQDADTLWFNVLEGGKNQGGKLWENIFSRSQDKRGSASPYDYFVKTYMQMQNNPQMIKNPEAAQFVQQVMSIAGSPEVPVEGEEDFDLSYNDNLQELINANKPV